MLEQVKQWRVGGRGRGRGPLMFQGYQWSYGSFLSGQPPRRTRDGSNGSGTVTTMSLCDAGNNTQCDVYL